MILSHKLHVISLFKRELDILKMLFRINETNLLKIIHNVLRVVFSDGKYFNIHITLYSHCLILIDVYISKYIQTMCVILK